MARYCILYMHSYYLSVWWSLFDVLGTQRLKNVTCPFLSVWLSGTGSGFTCWTGVETLMKGLAQSDAEINRRDQCRTVCRLIFRGDPCIILSSDILSVSMSAPRYPSEMRKPDTVPCNSALNPGHWGFSITPQMEWRPLHTAKERQHYLSSHQCFTPLKLKNKWTRFCGISLIWNHITAVCQDGGFWRSEVNFFLKKKASEVHLHGLSL